MSSTPVPAPFGSVHESKWPNNFAPLKPTPIHKHAFERFLDDLRLSATKEGMIKEQELLFAWDTRLAINPSELLMDGLPNSAKETVANLCIKPSEDEKTFELSEGAKLRKQVSLSLFCTIPGPQQK